jgi:N-acetyl-anhydromuramyl-L-alanine amidase AmpD
LISLDFFASFFYQEKNEESEFEIKNIPLKTLKQLPPSPEVAELQKFLHITPDGIFGPITYKHVRSWQSAYGLTSDGIVGPKTYAMLYKSGFRKCVSHTPIEEHPVDELVEQYFLPENAYFGTQTKKKWIFLHHTAGWNNPYQVVDFWSTQQNRVATQFVIGGQSILDNDMNYDGKIIQAIPDNGWAWHLGIGNQPMHQQSIGIELCNFGYLQENALGEHVTYTGRVVDEAQVEELDSPFRGFSFFHKYSDQQLNQLKKLLENLGEEHGIDIRKGLPELIRKKGAKAFAITSVQMCVNSPGIWSHTNVRWDKIDVAPQQNLVDLLLSLR